MITFFPVVERELRIASRNKWTYWSRLGAASLAFVIACFMFIFWLAANTGGQGLFATLSFFAVMFCLVDGIRTTADCISEEKRDGTLGLLFLTDLSGTDIVLGKLASTALRSFYGLLATFPILGLTVLMGGVTAGEFWGMIVALTVILILSQSVAIFASSICWHERHAVSMSLAVLAGLVFGPLIPSWVGLIAGRASAFNMDGLSPYRLYMLAFNGGFTSPAFLESLTINLASAMVFLFLACWFVRRRWQHQPALSMTTLLPARLQAAVQPDRKAAWRTKWLEVNPITWSLLRDQRRFDEWGRPLLFGLIALAALIMVPQLLFGMAIGTALAFNFLLKLRLAAQAARLGAELRDEGRLELLMTTPLGHKRILDGLRLSLNDIFFRPAVVLVAIEFVAILVGAFCVEGGVGTVLPMGVIVGGVFYLAALAVDFYAIASTGLWYGFSMGKPARAAIRTIVFLQILPIFLMIVPFFGLFSGLIVNAVFLGLSQSWLNSQFLRIATGQPGIVFGPIAVDGAFGTTGPPSRSSPQSTI